MSCPDPPKPLGNRPGLRALTYRIGDYTSFRDRLLSRLTCLQVLPDQPQGISLRQLNTRSEDDPAIALLEAVAVIADVLTFYQERIINEGYLLTATERRSVLELARMIGYELNPGVAASTMLAFTVEDTPNSPTVAFIPKGTQILSVPEKDEVPQTFETSEAFTARREWNALKPRPDRPQKLTSESRSLLLQGTSIGLQPGDALLLLDDYRPDKPHYLLTLDTVTPNPAAGHTTVTWKQQLPAVLEKPPRNPTALAFRQRASLFGNNSPRWESVSDEIKLANGGKIKGGVYRFEDYEGESSDRWRSVNAGFLSFEIQCLVVNPTNSTLLVGTPLGVFCSKNNGATWAVSNGGLTNTNVQTLFARADGELLAGTPNGGVFRSTDDGATWAPIGTGSIKVTIKKILASGSEPEKQISETENTAIPNTTVHAVASFTISSTPPVLGTLSSPDPNLDPPEERTRITINGSSGALGLQVGDVVVAKNQAKSITEIINPTTFRVNSVFNPRLENNAYAIFRTDPATGTLYNPFILSLSNTFAGTDEGIFKSIDQGKNWRLNQTGSGLPNKTVRYLLTYLNGTSQYLLAVLDEGIYWTRDAGTRWNLGSIPAGVVARSLAVRIDGSQFTLFAATNRGVYQSGDNGNSWTIGADSPTATVLAIAVNPTSKEIFAATKTRIYKSSSNGASWQAMAEVVETDTALMVSAIAAYTREPSSVPSLFIAAAFTGFANTEWSNFQIQKAEPGTEQSIDLNTTYPKVLPDSCILLQHRERYELVKVKNIAEVQRKDFTLDSKISRISTDTFVDQLEEFKLRETLVLVQSESLSLMREPLTVSMQQQMIFFDPIWTNKVLLSQYVSGLLSQHPVIVSGKRMRAELLNVGGFVHSVPVTALGEEQSWHRNNAGLTNTNVTAFTFHLNPEEGTIAHNPLAVRGDQTTFTQELKEGGKIRIEGVEVTIDKIYTDESMLVQKVVQREGELRPASGELSNKPFQYSGIGTGTLSSQGTTVSGSNTQFIKELKVGIRLVAAGQEVTIGKIKSDITLITAPAFAPELPPGTIFTYKGDGTGTISVDRTAIRGIDTQFGSDLKIDQAIMINNQTRIIQRIHSDAILFVDAEIDPNLTDAHFLSNTLFVGTQGGVFRSINNGTLWEPINQGLTDLQIQAIAVQSIQETPEDPKRNGYQLFVGTANGIFWTEPVFEIDGDVRWLAANTNLVHPDVRTLLLVKADNTSESDVLLAGTINGGVFRSVDGAQTWQQTGLDGVDVQCLAIAPNGDWYAGTIADHVYCSRNGGITWDQLKAGLENPNITSLLVYTRAGTGTLTSQGVTVMGQSATPSQKGTAFTTELEIGDTLIVSGKAGRVAKVVSDQQLELDQAFDGGDITDAIPFEIERVLAGTAGSGIFMLQSDPNQNPVWKPLPKNPADLNITCLTALTLNGNTDLIAGTITGGIFRSPDRGNSWFPFNTGLTSLNAEINPAGIVNTEFRAVATLNQHLFAVGIGILISPDYLYTTPIRSGDRLHLMSPPVPLPEKGREQELKSFQEQRWLLSDRDGFVGVVMTAQQDDIRLLPAATDDSSISELNAVALPPQDQQLPLLTLEKTIQTSYDPQTVSIYANVVPTTHGETVQELLGSGDGTIANPKFMLKKPPLTYVAAPNPRGSNSTLQLRVNDVLWTEVPTLYERSPTDQVYTVRLSDEGAVTITFGDGVSGVRLPTGEDNITATYQTGIGLAGLLGSERLSLLKTRPLGISEVTNPLPATGAEDPETMAEAQVSAPLTVRTLDRIVSLQDYEDFARAFPGIGKAQATLLGAGAAQQVHITVAAIGGRDVLPNSALYTNLVRGIDAARDPVQQVQVASYESLTFNLEARLLLDPRYILEKVLAEAKQKVLSYFAFENRDFEQAVTASEAIAVLQTVEGVIAVDLDFLHRRDLTRSLEQSILVEPARWDAARRLVLPAQLLVVNPAAIRLTQVEASL